MSPGVGKLSLRVRTKNAPLSFLRPFMRGVFDGIGKDMRNSIHLFNPFSRLSLRKGIGTRVRVGIGVLGTAFLTSTSSMRVTSNLFHFRGIHLRSARKRAKLTGKRLQRAGLGGLDCRFHFGASHVLMFRSRGRAPRFPFCNRVCTAKGMFLQKNSKRLGISKRIHTSGRARFICMLKATTRTAGSNFVAFMSHAPHHGRTTIGTRICRPLGRPSGRSSSSAPATVRVGLRVRPTRHTGVGVVVSPSTKSCVSTCKANGLHVGFFGRNGFRVFNGCGVARKVCGVDVRGIVQGSFALRPKNIMSFGNSPGTTGLGIRTICAIGSTSLGSLVTSTSSSHKGIQMGYLLGLDNGLASPGLAFKLRLPAIDRRSHRLIHDLADARRRVGARVVCLLKINGFCACSCTGGAKRASTADSLTFDALSNRLGGVLSRIVSGRG